MREYRYLGGVWHDCHILALTKQAYEGGLGKLLGSQGRGGEAR